MTIKWISTAHKGLRYYEHQERKHGKQRDRYYSIRFRVDGVLYSYGVGWLSDGIPDAIRQIEPEIGFQDYCLKLLRQYKGNVKTGSGPKSPKESRTIEKEKEAAETAEAAIKKAAVEANRQYTLKALLASYADYLEVRGKVKSAKAARSTTKVHVLEADPTLADKTATSITAHDIAALIRQTREKGKERTAGILRSTISAAYNCGRRAPFDTELPSTFIKYNIINNPVDVIPTIPVRAGNRTLTKDELKMYMAVLGDDIIDMALKLALFAGGQRMAELLRAEITDWNADTKTLRLLDPKGKRRVAREHFVPLGPIAASMVSTLIKQSAAKEANCLFPSRTKKPVHDSMPGPRVAEIAAAMGGKPFDLRDIRRTAETMLVSIGVTRDVRAQLLSHGISGVQAQHYDRHDYLKEKRAALVKWERHLTTIASGKEENKVIQLSTARM